MIDTNLEWQASWGRIDRDSKDAKKIALQVKDLIKAGVNVNLRSSSEDTVLIIAAWEGYTDVAEQMIAAGAKLNLKNKMGETALHVAAARGNTEVFEKLVAAGAWIDTKDYRKMTPLMDAAFFGNIDIVKRLLALGADTFLVDDQGKTAEDIKSLIISVMINSLRQKSVTVLLHRTVSVLTQFLISENTQNTQKIYMWLQALTNGE